MKRLHFSPRMRERDAIDDREVLAVAPLALTLNLEEAQQLVIDVVEQLSSETTTLAKLLRQLPELILLTTGEDVVQVSLPRGLLERTGDEDDDDDDEDHEDTPINPATAAAPGVFPLPLQQIEPGLFVSQVGLMGPKRYEVTRVLASHTGVVRQWLEFKLGEREVPIDSIGIETLGSLGQVVPGHYELGAGDVVRVRVDPTHLHPGVSLMLLVVEKPEGEE